MESPCEILDNTPTCYLGQHFLNRRTAVEALKQFLKNQLFRSWSWLLIGYRGGGDMLIMQCSGAVYSLQEIKEAYIALLVH